ncbi:MAG TPA: hypothetical protein PLW37_10940 [bacterium]|jgi:hypothetical protein|nr:hypothetical protein [bacterium]HPM47965.1 hypothetical protein [bacterium]HPY15311.1 hypothetical protein [bacterium]HQB10376.1 hypothetical protein [bacterium]
MLDSRILLKSLNDLEVRIMLCKSAFEWELLAKKYVDVESNIKDFFKKKKIPENFATALDTLRASLVQKKGELPPVDLSDFFK